ncbi:histidinol-phosphate transaminase [Solemya velum gill symbiont]|nr:histidinol-phosphate transaminase [Solemya velum gill symbiont]OOZ50904.1 histidinol-phosphate transaminase [Solemya velum gill symbiont]OOZ57184.1 histidinol-phosphate transaminase [Solemya velum gill symbiont]OOZ63075.1 histidinol-phosphate transaminase [Solemya velum gill symbiont]OOZ65614.1 histidinol-phosphate transaminase [Solemya velum gill symbiont]
MEKRIRQWIRPEVQAINAYHVPLSEGLIKLDAMENPYTWPETMRDEWAALIRETDVNRYPDPQAATLTQALREAMQIPGDAGVLLGNGSDEIIQMLALALGGEQRVILSVEPSFVMYRMIAEFSGLRYVGVPLDADDFSLQPEVLLAEIAQHQPAVVYLAYPNNPTGNLFDIDVIEKVIAVAPGLVVIDEAYSPFTDASFMQRVGDYDNLVVMRTVSKMGLAGLRLGLLAGPAEWIEQIDKTRLPYNINRLTQVSASFALKHKQLFDEQTNRLRVERESLLAELASIPAVKVFPSEANFILIRLEQGDASETFDAIRAQGVLIKNLSNSHPLLANCLRVTVGTQEENAAFLTAFRRVYQP